MKKMKNGILFVCYGNACRSIMAEAIAKHHFGDSLKIASAGIAALGSIPPDTLQALQDAGFICEGLRSKGLDAIDAARFDLIVNLTDLPIERFIPRGFRGRIVNRHIPDPYGRGPMAYREARESIRRFILETLPKLVE